MSSGRSDAAVRVIQLTDEILALVRSWPARWRGSGAISSKPEPDAPLLREIDIARLQAFIPLDAKLAGAASLAGIPILLGQVGLMDYEHPRGYTELAIFDRWACHLEDWEHRLLALTHAAQEIVDIEKPTEPRPANSPREIFEEVFGRDYQLPDGVKEKLRDAPKRMANYPIEQVSLNSQQTRHDNTYRNVKRKAGRRSNPERDDRILAAIESRLYSTLNEVGLAFGGITRSAVSKAAKRARKRRK